MKRNAMFCLPFPDFKIEGCSEQCLLHTITTLECMYVYMYVYLYAVFILPLSLLSLRNLFALPCKH